ncbi:MAG: hypothetical protein AB7V27_18885 [Candidatus Binatia bacterium]
MALLTGQAHSTSPKWPRGIDAAELDRRRCDAGISFAVVEKFSLTAARVRSLSGAGSARHIQPFVSAMPMGARLQLPDRELMNLRWRRSNDRAEGNVKPRRAGSLRALALKI